MKIFMLAQERKFSTTKNGIIALAKTIAPRYGEKAVGMPMVVKSNEYFREAVVVVPCLTRDDKVKLRRRTIRICDVQEENNVLVDYLGNL